MARGILDHHREVGTDGVAVARPPAIDGQRELRPGEAEGEGHALPSADIAPQAAQKQIEQFPCRDRVPGIETVAVEPPTQVHRSRRLSARRREAGLNIETLAGLFRHLIEQLDLHAARLRGRVVRRGLGAVEVRIARGDGLPDDAQALSSQIVRYCRLQARQDVIEQKMAVHQAALADQPEEKGKRVTAGRKVEFEAGGCAPLAMDLEGVESQARGEGGEEFGKRLAGIAVERLARQVLPSGPGGIVRPDVVQVLDGDGVTGLPVAVLVAGHGKDGMLSLTDHRRAAVAVVDQGRLRVEQLGVRIGETHDLQRPGVLDGPGLA